LTIWDGISGHGRDWSDESHFCWIQLVAASAYGDRETQHFYRNILSLVVLWRIVSSGHFIGLLARNLALLRRLLTVRLLMHPLTIHRLRSVFPVLIGCCMESVLRSLSSLAVIFRGFPVLTWPYGMEYQVMAETGRMKVIFVESSWWPRPRMETEKHSISIETYCRHNYLALSSIRIGRLANGWQSKWGTTNGRRIWSRYLCPVPS
jgi:hypothetical protein